MITLVKHEIVGENTDKTGEKVNILILIQRYIMDEKALKIINFFSSKLLL